MFDDDVLYVVEKDLECGQIERLADPDCYFDLIQRRFPIGFNRIDWCKVEAKSYVEVHDINRERCVEDVEQRLIASRGCVASWFASERVDMETQVVWIGDGTSFGLRMSATTLLDRFAALFAIPQHSYAIADNGDWCLNYTIEDDLFFGRAPSQ